MPGPGPCPRTINVHIDNDGNIVVQPPSSQINTVCQKIVFTFTPSLSDFAPEPITFPTPPPTGFDTWIGTITPGPGANQLTADAKQPLPPNSMQQKRYKYDVNPATGTPLDPDIQNDPYPPGGSSDGDEEGGDHGGGSHGHGKEQKSVNDN